MSSQPRKPNYSHLKKQKSWTQKALVHSAIRCLQAGNWPGALGSLILLKKKMKAAGNES